MPERKIRFQNRISGNFVFLDKKVDSGTVFSGKRYVPVLITRPTNISTRIKHSLNFARGKKVL